MLLISESNDVYAGGVVGYGEKAKKIEEVLDWWAASCFSLSISD